MLLSTGARLSSQKMSPSSASMPGGVEGWQGGKPRFLSVTGFPATSFWPYWALSCRNFVSIAGHDFKNTQYLQASYLPKRRHTSL